ncbi:glycosyltransferase family 4 protein [Fictibacillus sp. 7GRE50]|uniref:glycosyltransferase n=1 Tax=Fictibacillus sp. 7GRE50 TaxID=2745878 RepID=UPI0018CC9E1C|nr:glycosyltransferase [Fictibacillus sp. 7GRE50]MBH0164079.1 glycosyltransferase family 4 protein [Fictibacillus sp. 7GRE50]
MKILVLVQDYPSTTNKYAMSYVHTRNLEYLRKGLEVTVLSFSAKASYTYENINVITHEAFQPSQKYDLFISHAPNLRNHIRFLMKHKTSFAKLLMFLHGHEVLIKKDFYPPAYDYMQKGKKQISFADQMYDQIKVRVMKNFMTKLMKENKLKIIFVSEWMKEAFFQCVKADRKLTEENSYVISNSMNSVFLTESYQPKQELKADFITIRPLDQSKYGVDLVAKVAKAHPQYTFHIYGKGKYFDYHEKPENITLINEFLTPADFPDTLNSYRCAIMPTRLDAQGVMMCEIATYGMPIVTSDISICKEMLGDFDNAFFMNNERADINLDEVFEKIDLNKLTVDPKAKFSYEETIEKEVEVIQSLKSSN